MRDIGKSFKILVSTFFIQYRGVLIERKNGGYFWRSIFYPTLKELDDAILGSYEDIGKSINRLKNVCSSKDDAARQ